MSTTASFRNDPVGYTSRYAFIVDESAIAEDSAAAFAGAGPTHALNAADWLKRFTVESADLGRSVRIRNGRTLHTSSCYFLPYLPDHAISLTLGADADWFFTSTLTGCTIRVSGPRATPTVTHANAAQAWGQARLAAIPMDGATHRRMDEQLCSDAQIQHAEAMAAAAATGQIQHLMGPAAVGGPTSSLTRATYAGRHTDANFQYGKARITDQKANYTFRNNVRPRVTQSGRPEIAVFVFGQRVGGDWSFYYQTTVGMQGDVDVTRKLKAAKVKSAITMQAILGATQRFYP